MFDLYGTQRLEAWRSFRDILETHEKPFDLVAEFWSQAPFVNNYLDPYYPDSWPDPWHLILDDRLDDLAIALGMCYTLKLTQRFSDVKVEIYKSTSDKKASRYYLVVDDVHVFNLEHGRVTSRRSLDKIDSYLIWSQLDSI